MFGGQAACLDTTFKSNGGMFPSTRHFQVKFALICVTSGLRQFFVLVREFSVYPGGIDKSSLASEFEGDFSKLTSSLIGARSFCTALTKLFMCLRI